MSHLADLWRGEFGDRYHARHDERRAEIVERNTNFFAHLYYEIIPDFVGNVLEFGAGTGLNLLALRDVIGAFSDGDLAGVEINAAACEEMRKAGFTVYEQSFIDAASWEPGSYDLVFTKGVLIHLDEEQLPAAYRALYEASNQYILICEYFAPKREMITYQDRAGICYRDDYAAGLWAAYPDLKFIGSGFGWSKDPEAGQDNCTWFLFEKVEPGEDEPDDGDDD